MTNILIKMNIFCRFFYIKNLQNLDSGIRITISDQLLICTTNLPQVVPNLLKTFKIMSIAEKIGK